jgi:hypothetical protein
MKFPRSTSRLVTTLALPAPALAGRAAPVGEVKCWGDGNASQHEPDAASLLPQWRRFALAARTGLILTLPS